MKVEDTPGNADRCMCPQCPTYNGCMGEADEVMFCSRGETACGPRAASCICPTCPVWKQYSLSDYYYCLEGAAK